MKVIRRFAVLQKCKGYDSESRWQRQEEEGPAVPEPGCGRCLTRAHSKGGLLEDSNFQQTVYSDTLILLERSDFSCIKFV